LGHHTRTAGGTYEGLFYRPTVLADVTADMPAYASEVFGPVAPVLRFSDFDEAAGIAADTEYGLSLGILTKDVMRGLELARRIPTGIVHINEQTVDDEPNIPFGGIYDSGTGTRFGGRAALAARHGKRAVARRAAVRGPAAPVHRGRGLGADGVRRRAAPLLRGRQTSTIFRRQ
jgi:acyl-CoA reductase-like NAD-dependent aldehyde dehydrogenase